MNSLFMISSITTHIYSFFGDGFRTNLPLKRVIPFVLWSNYLSSASRSLFGCINKISVSIAGILVITGIALALLKLRSRGMEVNDIDLEDIDLEEKDPLPIPLLKKSDRMIKLCDDGYLCQFERSILTNDPLPKNDWKTIWKRKQPDVFIQIEKKIFSLHKEILIHASPYFLHLISESWKKEKVFKVELPGVEEPEVFFERICAWLYTGKLPNDCDTWDRDTWLDIYTATDYLQLTSLNEWCQEVLCSSLDKTNAEKRLLVYGSPTLKQQVLEFMALQLGSEVDLAPCSQEKELEEKIKNFLLMTSEHSLHDEYKTFFTDRKGTYKSFSERHVERCNIYPYIYKKWLSTQIKDVSYDQYIIQAFLNKKMEQIFYPLWDKENKKPYDQGDLVINVSGREFSAHQLICKEIFKAEIEKAVEKDGIKMITINFSEKLFPKFLELLYTGSFSYFSNSPCGKFYISLDEIDSLLAYVCEKLHDRISSYSFDAIDTFLSGRISDIAQIEEIQVEEIIEKYPDLPLPKTHTFYLSKKISLATKTNLFIQTLNSQMLETLIRKFSQAVRIELKSITNLRTEDLALFTSLPKLKILTLHDCLDKCYGVGDRALISLSQLKCLKKLDISFSPPCCSFEEIKGYSFSSLKTLTVSFVLNENENVNQVSSQIDGLFRLFPNLTHLIYYAPEYLGVKIQEVFRQKLMQQYSENSLTLKSLCYRWITKFNCPQILPVQSADPFPPNFHIGHQVSNSWKYTMMWGKKEYIQYI